MSEQNLENKDPQFAIQRLYVKDISFETPHSPQVFQQKWQPEITLELNTSAKFLSDNTYDVSLNITVTVKNQDNVAFLIEVKQAGIFNVSGANDVQLQHILGSYCPTILYPYAREVISDIVGKASFPQLALAPVNFDALYAQQLKNKQPQTEVSPTQDNVVEE